MFASVQCPPYSTLSQRARMVKEALRRIKAGSSALTMVDAMRKLFKDCLLGEASGRSAVIFRFAERGYFVADFSGG
jgi:hypothetical protein